MNDILPVIEALENRWMRAWAGGDARTLKSLTSKKFRMVIGTKPCAILDSKSWIEAANSSFICNGYRFGDLYARNLGGIAVFATQLDLQASIDSHDWSGRMWLTDIWKKSGIRRNWRMVERVISRLDEDPQLPSAIRSLQAWRRPAQRRARAAALGEQ